MLLADAALHTGQAVNESERSIAQRSGLTVWMIAMAGAQVLYLATVAARCDSYKPPSDTLGVITTMLINFELSQIARLLLARSWRFRYPNAQ